MSQPNHRVRASAYRGSETFKDYHGPIDSVRIVPVDPHVLIGFSKAQKELALQQGFVIMVSGRYDHPGQLEAVAQIANAVNEHQAEGVEFVYGRDDKDYGYVVGNLPVGIVALGDSGRFSGIIINNLTKELPKIEAHQKTQGK